MPELADILRHLPAAAGWGITVFLGLVFGSFATALSYRLPRDISIVKTAHSFCPACNHRLTFLDLFPLLSWLALRGKCRHCGARIGWRYPLIELSTLLLCMGFYARFGLDPQVFILFALAPVLIAMADIDLHYKILPDGLNLCVFGFALLALLLGAFMTDNPPEFILSQGGEGLAGAIIYVTVALILRQSVMLVLKKESMGWGDIKFFAGAGLWLGLNALAGAYFMLVSGLSGVILALLWRRATGEREFPFGPSILTAFVAVLLWFGTPLLAAWR